MIKSVKFPKKGKGYLYAKPENPGKAPDKGDHKYTDWDFSSSMRGKRVFKEEKYAKDFAR